jgi:hypothetical protein
MPSLKENKKIWKKYDWSQKGEEWSINYGGSNQQWKKSIYPRIKQFIPVNTILEIGPGYGRITQYLIPYAKNQNCNVLIKK